MEISNKALEFLNNEKDSKERKISKLEPYKNDIFYLKNNGIPITKILEFLEKEHEVKTSYPNLLNWIKRQNEYKKTDIKEVSESKKESTNENLVIKKYPNTDGGLEKHNLKDKINRPKEI
ncbi:hypothetical protein CRU99_01735 [Malaciobacter mytili]|uniref:hypothetical protein n=1 Tax=Malaciobacter mytili TaxID=603050 RepID=UPI00100AE9E4|nr:hypothetical protein [Malaciobacter mytili]RXI48005.1 hypothetical protein CRU99_01735 [Malaciobacter mytili]